MNHPTSTPKLPSLTTERLLADGTLIDNKFTKLWDSIGMKSLLNRTGFNKRSGTSISQVVYCLSLWIWEKQSSIGMFARESLATLSMGKDALYDMLNREDLNWRKLNLLVAYKATQTFNTSRKKAFVVDDSIKQRFGNKMPGVSRHFDHTTGRSLKGQQVLTLGLSCDEGFVPLDSELYTSKVDAQPLRHRLKDGRSTVGKRFRDAIGLSKPAMLAQMVKRALHQGVEADYLLADAWFGSKAVLRLCEETHLVGILRMKKGKLKYRVTKWIQGE